MKEEKELEEVIRACRSLIEFEPTNTDDRTRLELIEEILDWVMER